MYTKGKFRLLAYKESPKLGQFLLGAVWIAKNPMFVQMRSEDWSYADAQTDPSVRWPV